MMLKIQRYITEINILMYIKIKPFFKIVIFPNVAVFSVVLMK